MHQIGVLVVRVFAPALGVLLGLLGFATLGENILGWLLFVAGVAYAAGTIIAGYMLRKATWDPHASGAPSQAEASDPSFWLLTAGMAAVFFLSPLEFLYLRGTGLPVSWLDLGGACLACLGGVLFGWAQRSRTTARAGHALMQGGPYRFLRHPAYTGYLLAALGLALGYGSLWGTVALLAVLLPAVLWRIRIEEGLLARQLGTQYVEYASRTKRLIPGVW